MRPRGGESGRNVLKSAAEFERFLDQEQQNQACGSHDHGGSAGPCSQRCFAVLSEAFRKTGGFSAFIENVWNSRDSTPSPAPKSPRNLKAHHLGGCEGFPDCVWVGSAGAAAGRAGSPGGLGVSSAEKNKSLSPSRTIDVSRNSVNHKLGGGWNDSISIKPRSSSRCGSRGTRAAASPRQRT